MLIAIDGPAGAGKSTAARATAHRLGFSYLDTGAMYRGVALAALERGVPLDDPAALGALARSLQFELGSTVRVNGAPVGDRIRSPQVTDAASRVAQVEMVRGALVAAQRSMIARGRYVAEGRDVGTAIAPEAELKVFLTASDEERARRRAAESGEDASSVLAAQRTRDARDSGRAHAPLRPARDAVTLDSSGLDAEAVVDRIVELARERGLV
ncbi:MAG: (d)CMP kinase [Solirubrobacterales bacterium]